MPLQKLQRGPRTMRIKKNHKSEDKDFKLHLLDLEFKLHLLLCINTLHWASSFDLGNCGNYFFLSDQKFSLQVKCFKPHWKNNANSCNSKILTQSKLLVQKAEILISRSGQFYLTPHFWSKQIVVQVSCDAGIDASPHELCLGGGSGSVQI